jgi:hypothetical protein
MIENNEVVEESAIDTIEDTVDTKVVSKTYECKDCHVTRKIGSKNMRKAGSKYNGNGWDITVEFTYWDICEYCADRRIKA